MLNLESDIYTYLKSLAYSYDVTVRRANRKLTPVYPMITIQEIDNSTSVAIHGTEKRSNISYQIDVFAKDYYPDSAQTVCNTLATEIDSSIQSEYGLLRKSAVNIPDPNDDRVARTTLRYGGILDTVNEYIYH